MTNRSKFLGTHALHLIGAGMETASHMLSDDKDLKKELRLAGAAIGLLAALIELKMVFGQKNDDNSEHKTIAVIKGALTVIKFGLAIAEYYHAEDTKESKASATTLRNWHKGFTAMHGVFFLGHAAYDLRTLSIANKDNMEKLPSTAGASQTCMVPGA